MGNTQVLCFLILFAEAVDTDKVLRRYQWSRSGGQGLCERCPRCIQVLPQFGMRGWFFIPPQFNSKRAPLRVHTGGQNEDAIRAVPAKDRIANTEHEPLAFEC